MANEALTQDGRVFPIGHKSYQALAKFLGADSARPVKDLVVQPGARDHHYFEFLAESWYPTWSNADLMNALLQKAASLEDEFWLNYQDGQWLFEFYPAATMGTGDTAVEAVVHGCLEYQAQRDGR